MVKAVLNKSGKSDQIVLGVLRSVEEGANSQRRMAAELGIALGLVNAYLKRCLNKGLIKVREAPAHRYAYYLTPRGFAEKSRLTVEYLSFSFSFFRKAKADCADVFAAAKAQNFQTLVLRGKSDLAEIAILSAAESGVSILAVVDRTADGALLAGKPIVPDYDQVCSPFDAVVVTDLKSGNESFDEAIRLFGPHRVLAPLLLGLSPSKQRDAVL